MNIEKVLKKINFIERYKIICENHNDFENRLRGKYYYIYNNILKNLNIKYLKRNGFFQIRDEIMGYIIYLNLDMNEGLVEAFLYVEKGEKDYKPNGRFDFLPEGMGVEFDRSKYNLPKYKDAVELEIILKDIISIYQDFKAEVLKSR